VTNELFEIRSVGYFHHHAAWHHLRQLIRSKPLE
jgi:hypothetical protein